MRKPRAVIMKISKPLKTIQRLYRETSSFAINRPLRLKLYKVNEDHVEGPQYIA